jgi:hypothetical protein
MPKSIDEILADLSAFVPTTHDYNYEGRLQLAELTGQLRELPNAVQAIPVLLGILERFPHADLGTPGPVVHMLEALPGYEPYLLDSARNRPSPHTIEMICRLINGTDDLAAKRDLLNLMRDVRDNPAAVEPAREMSVGLLDWYASQGIE